MKKVSVFLTVLAIVLAFGLAFTACGGNDSGGSSEGSFTLTDIPSEYNGKYVMVGITNMPFWVGRIIVGFEAKDVNGYVQTQIQNGKATIPLWDDDWQWQRKVRYTGSETFEVCFVYLNDAQTIKSPDYTTIGTVRFDTVSFSGGNATRSWNAGQFFPK